MFFIAEPFEGLREHESAVGLSSHCLSHLSIGFRFATARERVPSPTHPRGDWGVI